MQDFKLKVNDGYIQSLVGEHSEIVQGLCMEWQWQGTYRGDVKSCSCGCTRIKYKVFESPLLRIVYGSKSKSNGFCVESTEDIPIWDID